MPPSTRGPYLQGSWLAPKPISSISFKHQNLFWCSISDKHLEVALNLLAYRLKGCCLPRSYCSPTKLHVSLQAINKSILGVRESDNINKLMAANQKFRVTQYIYICIYTLENHQLSWVQHMLNCKCICSQHSKLQWKNETFFLFHTIHVQSIQIYTPPAQTSKPQHRSKYL